jgi:hypothetical protein
MPNYTFTTSSSYALSTHEVTFTQTTLIIKLSSTGQTVYDKKYVDGVAFLCSGDDFCVGTLSDNGVFTKIVDYANKKAKMWLVEQTGHNKFIGSDDEGDTGIYNKYDLNECPVRLVPGTGKEVQIECPCENCTGTCTHSCYTYG